LFKDHAPAAGLLAKAVLKTTRCGGELLAILVEDNHTSRDTFAISVPRHAGQPAIRFNAWRMATCASRLINAYANGAFRSQNVSGRQSCLQRTYSPAI
jgi:hypothetical protein